MDYIDLDSVKKAHFFGVGGIGISALARLFLLQGKEVSGSDIAGSSITEELSRLGMRFFLGQDKDFVPPDADLIIYTIALEEYDPSFLAEIRALPVRSLSYPEALHAVSQGKYTVAVSGTHGKTTTTAMAAKVALEAGLDPTVIVGSLLKDYQSNLIVGKSNYFIVEACEYKRSFLNLDPNIVIITNIEADHLDYYKDLADIESAFAELVAKVPESGFVICDPSHPSVSRAVRGAKGKVIDYAAYLGEVDGLAVPGEHNRQNAAAALALAEVLGVSKEKAAASLRSFSGTWRRFDFKGESESGALVYDDYAHHPTEIVATLKAARERFPGKRIITVFQPHLFSRTKSLFNEFARSFAGTDLALFVPIFAAREYDDGTVSSASLADAVAREGVSSRSFGSFEEAATFLEAELQPDDVLFTLGAGKAYEIGEKLLKK